MTDYDEARAKLKAAMKEYGFTDADRVRWPGHVLDADADGCPCGAELACATCESVAPCIHGAERPSKLLHKQSN